MTQRPSTTETAALIAEAVACFDGSETKLARAAGFSQNAVWHARRVGRISGDLAAGIDRATKGRVPISRTRPDLLGSFDAASAPSLVNVPPPAPSGSVAEPSV